MIIKDKNGNSWESEFFGSEELAQKAMESCKGYMVRCTNCSNCTNCSYCVECTYCVLCTYCKNCNNCHICRRCVECVRGCFVNDSTNLIDRCDKNPLSKIPVAVPVIENIHKKIFDAASKVGSLDMNFYHSCETNHCRAGWAVHLAGEAGYELEKATSPVFAALQIYRASGYDINVTDFSVSNEESLKDMERLAT